MPLPPGRRTARSKRNNAATASISRTHSQCQREGRTPHVRAGRSPREDLVFISGEMFDATRAPPVAAKPRLMALSAPLADLAAGANQLRRFASAAAVVEPA